MRRWIRHLPCILWGTVMQTSTAAINAPTEPLYDLSTEKVLYCVGYAHLDTQWRWDFPTTIDRYIRDTLEQNFERFASYPGYVFSFTGSVRYEMMKEYYPEHYERLKQYIAEGRWFVSGSSVDEGDVNVPSAEAIIRQILYGNQFFRREFGKESLDFMLPDCFGFPASMPSIWAHCGLLGFSTQKLTWGSAVGIPFPVGIWEGPDGESIIAAFDPGSYASAVKGRVDLDPHWVERVNTNGERYGVWADYHYYGVGDMGGAPKSEDVANYLASMGNPDSQIQVALVSSDQMFKDITPELRAKLPRYTGDLLLTEHSAGTLTSQAYMKRWNRKNEILADAAERAAVMAMVQGTAAYPQEKLNRSWVRLLANQMHDILPGTSIPRAYTYSWNDEIVASNGFAAVLTDSVGAMARLMDTQTEGSPLVIYNPLAVEREDVVTATATFDRPVDALHVVDPSGRMIPAQILSRTDGEVTFIFAALVPPLGLGVFDVRIGRAPSSANTSLSVTSSSIENERYRLTLDAAGDIASIVDKQAGDRELLASPSKLVFTFERPQHYPAWNMDWADRQNAPIDFVKGPARVRIVERGPVRGALEITREARNSVITQTIRLAAGEAGNRIEIANDIDWQSTECALKASFPLTVHHSEATYNWGMGTIERGNNEPTKYEVPSHEWFDLTDADGSYGVSILDDCKYGSDKPSDNEVRLTLLYTPGVRSSFMDQHSQDWGRHEFVYSIYGHDGDWRDGRSEWQGRRVNQPLRPFVASRHRGAMGRTYSLGSVNTPQVDIRAVKKSEDSDVVIIRLQELWGREVENVAVTLGEDILDAYEVDGQERRIGDAQFSRDSLTLNMSPYSPRSFAVRLKSQGHDRPSCRSVALEFNADIASSDADRTDGHLDRHGRTLPAEMLPAEIVSEGIRFELGPTVPGADQAISCRGQTVVLPAGDFDRLYLLATATEDAESTLRLNGETRALSVQGWTGFVGQFDDRIWDTEFEEVDFQCDGKVIGFNPGYTRRDPIAWFCTHRHHPIHGNEAYQFSYLYKYGFDLRPGTKEVVLPDDPRIYILAMTVANRSNSQVRPAAPLYDDFGNRAPITLRHEYPPPPVPVFEGLRPAAVVTADRQSTFESLSMGAPVTTDFVDQSSGGGIVFTYHDGGGEWRPHPSAGAEEGTLPRLNDGQVAQNHDDTMRCVWYDNEGRFSVNLGEPKSIDRINTYSWHRSNRAPQKFSLWGSNADIMPDIAITAESREGWDLVAVVNTSDLGNGDIHGSSVHGDGKPLGPYRYLLWIAEEVGEGTFFTEIDVHVAD